MNRIILIGNISKELTHNTQHRVTNTSLAVNKRYTDKSGNKIDKVCFIDIAFFGEMSENTLKHLSIGDKIAIDGSIEYDTWADKDGRKNSKHSINVKEVDFLVVKKWENKEEARDEQNQEQDSSLENEISKEVDISKEDISAATQTIQKDLERQLNTISQEKSQEVKKDENIHTQTK